MLKFLSIRCSFTLQQVPSTCDKASSVSQGNMVSKRGSGKCQLNPVTHSVLLDCTFQDTMRAVLIAFARRIHFSLGTVERTNYPSSHYALAQKVKALITLARSIQSSLESIAF